MSLAPNYFNLDSVSNSDLKQLRNSLRAIADNREGLQEIFNFGSLVDAFITEPFRTNHKLCSLELETGSTVYFAKVDYMRAEELARKIRADRVASMLIAQSKGQYIFNRTLSFVYDGDEYRIKARCKFDGFNRALGLGVDYKGLSCTTLAQFKTAIDFFDYDQQAAWYMDIAKINTHWIIAISKKTGEVFKHAIRRGDETYIRGYEKYSKLAYQWLMLIDNFNVGI